MIKELRASDPVTVGPYKLLGRLGAGGMGQVFLGKSPGGRLVAIKLIRPDLAEERGFRERFAGEISAARGVSGIYTAAVVDADADAELPWMATVYVPGPSLTDAVEENGPLPVRSVFALAAGLAEALQAIHRAGLVHRDMKPSNVLLAADGPRVIDFGISRALERSMMTTTGMVLGSPGFMSPEQAMGEQVGQPSDVFSLGAVLAYAATGAGPFGTGPVTALLYRVAREDPDLSQVPERLHPVVSACLAKTPADRPTPDELLTSLSAEVEVITGEWLPEAIATGMNRYSPTLATPLPPPFRAPDSGQLPPAPGAEPATGPQPAVRPSAAGQPVARPSTELAAIHPSQPQPQAWQQQPPQTPPAAGDERFAATSLVDFTGGAATGAGARNAGYATAGGAGNPTNPFAGGGPTGPTIPGGPGGPPARRRPRRWGLVAVLAAVVVIAAAVSAFALRSGGGAKNNPGPTASVAGTVTPTPTTSASPTPSSTPSASSVTSSAPTYTHSATWTPTSTWSATPTSSPTWTSSPTATPTATATSTPTTQPTTSTTTQPTTSATTNQTSAATAAATP